MSSEDADVDTEYDIMLRAGMALEKTGDTNRDLLAALHCYQRAAELEDDNWGDTPGDARYRAARLRQQLATSDEDRAWAKRYFRKAAELGHMKARLEAAKLMIQSRDGYEYSQYKYRGQWERENEEYDAQFAEGVALLEKVAGQSNSDAEDRIKALSILAEIYEDERIRCRSQFEPIGDRERLECALEYYRTLSQLDVNADDQARHYYRDSIVRIQSMLNALPENAEDSE